MSVRVGDGPERAEAARDRIKLGGWFRSIRLHLNMTMSVLVPATLPVRRRALATRCR